MSTQPKVRYEIVENMIPDNDERYGIGVLVNNEFPLGHPWRYFGGQFHTDKDGNVYSMTPIGEDCLYQRAEEARDFAKSLINLLFAQRLYEAAHQALYRYSNWDPRFEDRVAKYVFAPQSWNTLGIGIEAFVKDLPPIEGVTSSMRMKFVMEENSNYQQALRENDKIGKLV